MKKNPANWPYRISCVISLSCCIFLGGCVGATRLPVRATSPAGGTIQKNAIDLSFLQVSATHHQEVSNQLAAIDTSYSNPRLFWGRWGESRWGYWWFIAAPCNTNCAAGDAKRIWHVQNLLVTFDLDGVVTSKETVTDDAKLWRALHSHMVEAPPLDFSQPIRVTLTNSEPSTILLGPETMEFEPSVREDKPNVPASTHSVVRFSHGKTANKKTSPGVTCHALEFSGKTGYGKKIKFCAEASQIGILFQYLQQAGPPNMAWQ